MARPASPTRLLVVEADDAARTLVRRRFTRLGYEVMETGEAAKALSLISMIPFDLVLLDLETPCTDDVGGLELLREMRESRSAAELPILALAEETAGEAAVEALSLGADDCLGQPLDLEVAVARVGMHVRRRRQDDAGRAADRELRVRLEKLKEAVVHAEATSAVLEGLGHDVRAPLNGLIGAAASLVKVCETAELKPALSTVETAIGSLDLLMVQALGRADRRNRAPKTQIRVLLADDDAGSRLAMRDLLHATEAAVELVEVAAGLQAALAAETHFFDLILMHLSAPEVVAGIRAIRRAERQNKTRRTPILAFGSGGPTAAQTLDAGADLVMRPPVTATRLLCALAEAVARESQDIGAVA
jgi:DNA-binding response OmpR family regulator